MKIFKVFVLSILSIFISLYLAFLFILPNCIDLNKYLPQITKIIQDKSGFQVELEGLKVKTAWNLSAGALVNKVDLKDSTGEKFAQINGLQVRLSLLPLVFGNLKIDKVDANKVLANIPLIPTLSPKGRGSNNLKLAAHCSPKMPTIYVKKYRISFIDNVNNYTLKGDNLKIFDFILNKKIKLKANGNLILNDRKQISYNVSIFSKIFPKAGGQQNDFAKIFDDLYKYNVNANIKTDLKINNDHDIDGKINLDKISFTLGDKIFPQSVLKLDFNKDKIKINSSLHTDANSKTIITGFYKNGKNKKIDLKVVSDETKLGNAVFMAKNILKIFGKKDLEGIDASGYMNANFRIKSDFKKIESDGYLKIKNANLTNKLYNVSLSSLNSDIDFSQNAVQIRQASAKLNSQPITITGNIDKNANADILVFAKNLQLKGVLLTSGNVKVLNENDILSGLVNVKAILKGRLNKAVPKINVIISNVDLKNRQSKNEIKIAKVAISSSYNKDTKKAKGTADINSLKVLSPAYSVISAPKISLVFDEKNLDIAQSYLYINNIKTNLSGKISNLNSTPHINEISISIPNQISVPIKGYAGSSAVLKGNLIISGDLYKPEIKGLVNIPSIRIPTVSTVGKNIILKFDKDININCPQLQVADSSMSINAQIDKNVSEGIVARNVKLASSNLDLNTLIPVIKNLTKNSSSNSNITILNGKSTIGAFKVGGLSANNITSDISLKSNVLYLNNLLGEAYFGKFGGNISYDLNHQKTYINLKGRGLSANSVLIGLTGRDDDIHGQLDFDTNISMTGYSKTDLLSSLKGSTHFIISNGKMGILGKFEHLLYAQNVVSNNVFRATLNGIAKAITVKNTGVYKYMRGKITFSDGWINISKIKTSGPSMSLYITGRYYLLNNTANLIILGRISDDVVRILGPIGEFSMDKAILSIPKLGEITAFFANQFTTNPIYENTSQIPYLTPKTELPTKEFKVIIDGDTQAQSSVKSFKWLSRPKINQSTPMQNQPTVAPSQNSTSTPTIPDFINKLPDLKKQ